MTRGARMWGAALPAEIICHAFYRPDARSAAGREEATVTVARSDTLRGAKGSVEFATMALSVTYFGDTPEGHKACMVVTGADGQELARHLYQFGNPPPQDISFAGGHGFTGLVYVTHGDAQLQYRCAASA